ncbi:unnamed protein product [Effrenium voratum]|uniref:Pentatricopeptide repeat-containing protein, chloroplastic n=1 Tax=Effrenium voratum TaxID=2562239 RepID=A0AA36NM27_9DINO|nr:unnamed protein product [Effrenium voratum]
MKHFSKCFVCSDGCEVPKRGRAKVEVNQELATEIFCSTCPQTYHRRCLPPHARELKKNWVCTWHYCSQCRRGASDVGGMLIHCLECPSALCYDCFPPNFRRVYPPERFWTEMKNRGWNTSPQKMIFFKCNSCRTLEEQQNRLRMREEELAVQQDAKKRAALEEKRNLETTKKRQAEEEARRRMKTFLLEHERQQLSQELVKWRTRVEHAAESLWPKIFRGKWIYRVNLSQQSVQDIGQALVGKKAAAPSVESLKLPIETCSNCHFPGHKIKQCPLPAEKSTERSKEEGKDKTSYKRVCPICGNTSHPRICCPKMSPEQRAEYMERCKDFKLLQDAFEEASAVPEPPKAKDFKDSTPAHALVEAFKLTEANPFPLFYGTTHLEWFTRALSYEQRAKARTRQLLQLRRLRAWEAALAGLFDHPPSLIHCNVVLSTLADQGRWQQALQLFSTLHQVSAVTFNACIAACAKAARWVQALAILEEMQQRRVRQDTIAFNTTITSMAKGFRWDAATELLEKMQKATVVTDVVTYNAVMNAYQQGACWQQAHALLDTMHDKLLPADAVTWSTAISAAARGLWQLALQLLSQAPPRVLNGHSYNACISACERGFQWQAALGLLQEMVSVHLQPDVVSFNAAVSACDTGQQWQLALRVYDHMEQARLQHDQVSHNSAISALATGAQWQVALLFLEGDANLISFNSAMAACHRASEWQSAAALLQALHRRTMQPDSLSYNVVISACHKLSRWQSALQLLAVLRRQRLTSEHSCGSAISACESCNQWETALQLLQDMQEESVRASTIAFNAGISACGKGAQWQLALCLLGRMKQEMLTPDLVSQNALLACLASAACWEAALARLEEMEPDVISFRSCLEALSAALQWRSSLQLLAHMRSTRSSSAVALQAAMDICRSAGHWAPLQLPARPRHCLQLKDLLTQCELLSSLSTAKTERWDAGPSHPVTPQDDLQLQSLVRFALGQAKIREQVREVMRRVGLERLVVFSAAEEAAEAKAAAEKAKAAEKAEKAAQAAAKKAEARAAAKKAAEEKAAAKAAAKKEAKDAKDKRRCEEEEESKQKAESAKKRKADAAPAGNKQPKRNAEVVRYITDGPAKGWMVKGKGYKSTNQFFVKRPDSQIYESRHQALKDAEEPVADAVEAMRRIVAAELAAPSEQLQVSSSEGRESSPASSSAKKRLRLSKPEPNGRPTKELKRHASVASIASSSEGIPTLD